MEATKLAILHALSNLRKSDFELFKWHLKNGGAQHKSIPVGKLEKANDHDVVDLMAQQYLSNAGRIAVSVLHKMDQNDLANTLQGELSKVPEDVSAGGGASSGAAAATVSTAGVTVTISSASGGTVKAPVFNGAFNAPVNLTL